MEITAGEKTKTIFESGTYMGRVQSVIEIGTVKTPFFQEDKATQKRIIDKDGNPIPKWQHQVKIAFELYDEDRMTFAAKDIQISMGDLSTLKKWCEALLNIKIKQNDIVDIKKLVGTTGLVTVEAKEVNSKVYLGVRNVSPLMKGMEVPEAKTFPFFISYKDWNEELFQKLPTYVKEKMSLTAEYRNMRLRQDKKEEDNKPQDWSEEFAHYDKVKAEKTQDVIEEIIDSKQVDF